MVLVLPGDEEVSTGTYHFVRAMRSADLNPEELLPIVILASSDEQIPVRFKR